MAKQKHPKLNDLVRRGVEADDLDEMHYEEEQCPSTRTVVPKVTPGRSSERSARGRKWQKEAVQNARRSKTEMEAPEPRSPRRSE